MKSIIRIAAIAVALQLAAAGAAAAKDTCLTDGGGNYIFTKLKLPKKPGATTSLQGARIQGMLGPYPFNGSVTMNTAGDYHVAIVVRPYAAFSNELVMGWIATDATLAGTAAYSNDGDQYNDDGTLNLTAADCSTIVVP